MISRLLYLNEPSSVDARRLPSDMLDRALEIGQVDALKYLIIMEVLELSSWSSGLFWLLGELSSIRNRSDLKALFGVSDLESIGV